LQGPCAEKDAQKPVKRRKTLKVVDRLSTPAYNDFSPPPLKEIVTEFLHIDLQSVRRFAAAAVSRTDT
jgi:hypothetical protein